MFLVAGPSPEFLKFIQILAWIIAPIFLIAIVVTIYMHYRKRKKKDQLTGAEEDELLEASPEQVGYTKGDGEYVLFDHSPLIQEYKDRLTYHHARNAALQQDMDKLSAKYDLLINYATFSFDSSNSTKKETMEQLTSNTAESTILETSVEQHFLKDMVEEKKAQIEFLQSQLDNRLKQQHEVEQQRLAVLAELEAAQQRTHEAALQIEKLKNDLILKQDEADRLQVKICEKEELLTARDALIIAKDNQVTYLENQLQQNKEQQEILQADAHDNRDKVSALEIKLADEASKLKYVEEKLELNKNLIKRVYKEFSGFIAEEELEPEVP